MRFVFKLLAIWDIVVDSYKTYINKNYIEKREEVI